MECARRLLIDKPLHRSMKCSSIFHRFDRSSWSLDPFHRKDRLVSSGTWNYSSDCSNRSSNHLHKADISNEWWRFVGLASLLPPISRLLVELRLMGRLSARIILVRTVGFGWLSCSSHQSPQLRWIWRFVLRWSFRGQSRTDFRRNRSSLLPGWFGRFEVWIDRWVDCRDWFDGRVGRWIQNRGSWVRIVLFLCVRKGLVHSWSVGFAWFGWWLSIFFALPNSLSRRICWVTLGDEVVQMLGVEIRRLVPYRIVIGRTSCGAIRSVRERPILQSP